MSDLNKLGTISSTISQLNLDVNVATLTLRHAEQDDITINVNHADHWRLTPNGVRQTKVANGGVNVIGGSTIVAGDLVGGVVIGGGSISVGGRRISGRGISGGNISIINGQVYVDGRPLSDEQSPAQPKQDPDAIEIIVPLNFRGGVDLTISGHVNGTIDSWTGGSLSFNFSGSGKIDAGSLTELTSFVFNCSGTASLIADKVDTQMAVVVISGTGDLDLDELVAVTVSISSSGTGDISVLSGSAKSGTAHSSGTGDITLRGDFGAVSSRNTGMGNVRIRGAK